jgi:hypothetical protein
MSSVHRPAPEGPIRYACAEAGSQACVERLLRQHAGLVHWVIRRTGGGDLPYGELLYEGLIALWQAIRGYDPVRGLAFSTYDVPAIRHRPWKSGDPLSGLCRLQLDEALKQPANVAAFDHFRPMPIAEALSPHTKSEHRLDLGQ